MSKSIKHPFFLNKAWVAWLIRGRLCRMPGEDRPKQSVAIWSVAAGIPDQDCTETARAGLGDIEWMSRGNVAPGLVSVVAHSTAEYGERNYDSPADVVAEGCANQMTFLYTYSYHWAIHAAAAFRPIERDCTEPRCDFRCTLPPTPLFFWNVMTP
jgi:hypothetical protein